jgi:hypothetical protein
MKNPLRSNLKGIFFGLLGGGLLFNAFYLEQTKIFIDTSRPLIKQKPLHQNKIFGGLGICLELCGGNKRYENYIKFADYRDQTNYTKH